MTVFDYVNRYRCISEKVVTCFSVTIEVLKRKGVNLNQDYLEPIQLKVTLLVKLILI